MPAPDLVVLHEHPEWHKPLFAALERRKIAFEAFNVTRAAFANTDVPRARLYFNQASPSAYLRGNTRAVPLALAFMRTLEQLGARVLNGSNVFALELSKSVQATLLRSMGIDTPFSITFNDVRALRQHEASRPDADAIVADRAQEHGTGNEEASTGEREQFRHIRHSSEVTAPCDIAT